MRWHTGTRRRIALAGSVVVLVGVAVAVTVAATSGGSDKPSTSNNQYRDYMNGGGSSDGSGGSDAQCAKPPAERTGGWMCPSPAAHS